MLQVATSWTVNVNSIIHGLKRGKATFNSSFIIFRISSDEFIASELKSSLRACVEIDAHVTNGLTITWDFQIEFSTLIELILFVIFYQACKSCGVEIVLPENHLPVYHQKSQMERLQKYTVRNSNTVFSLVRIIMWLQYTYNILWALEPLHKRKLFNDEATIIS